MVSSSLSLSTQQLPALPSCGGHSYNALWGRRVAFRGLY
jgi:hypothetical protein